MRESDDDWFAPKLYGLGTGLPIRWQGWLALAIYVAVVLGVAYALTPRHPWLMIGITLAATLVFGVLCAQHTRGGWKWRWGNSD